MFGAIGLAYAKHNGPVLRQLSSVRSIALANVVVRHKGKASRSPAQAHACLAVASH